MDLLQQLISVFMVVNIALSLPLNTNNLEQGEHVEGDIIVIRDKNGVINIALRWPNGIVPYEIDPAFTTSEKTSIQLGMADYTSKTCVRWTPRIGELDYVYFTKANSGCYSNLGRIGGKQDINYQIPGCESRGTIVHEMMHAIGFWHEHSRPDRDAFVYINYANVLPGYAPQFYKQNYDVATTYDVQYNYGSVMHYPPDAFSINPPTFQTIVATQSLNGTVMGQRDGFADSDIWKINRMYNCTTYPLGSTTSSTSTTSTTRKPGVVHTNKYQRDYKLIRDFLGLDNFSLG